MSTTNQSTAPAAPCQNVAMSEKIGMSFDPSRAVRLRNIASILSREVQSLNAAASTFVQRDLGQSEMDPVITVQLFADAMQNHIDLMFSMFENEEDAQ